MTWLIPACSEKSTPEFFKEEVRELRSGPDPIKFTCTLVIRPITELEKGHMTHVIGQIPAKSKILR